MASSILTRAGVASAALVMLVACGDTTEVDGAYERKIAQVEATNAPIPNYQREVPEARPTDGTGADCNARLAAPFIGERVDSGTRAGLLSAVAPNEEVRWLEPGDAATQDYRPDRLNVTIDANGRISGLKCG